MELKKLISVVLCSVLLYVTGAEASNIQVPQNTLYNYHTTIALQEEFIFGSTSANALGTNGWGLANGTTTFPTATDVQHIGIVRRDTTAAINTIVTLQPTTIAFNVFAWSGTVQFDETWVAKLNNNDTDTYISFGFTETTSGSVPAANGTYLEKAAADTNWFCVNNNGAGITRVDTGVAVTTNWVTLRIVANATTTVCYVDSAATSNSSNIYSGGFAIPTMIMSNIAAASKTVDVDYWQMIIIGLSR